MKNELNVIFGTGPLAITTMKALLRRGKTIKMINRTGKRPPSVPDQVEILGGDAYSHEFSHNASDGAAVIYQCAQPAYHHWLTQFPALQASILQAAEAQGAKLVVGENLYMYGDTGGQPIVEDLPYAAHTRKGKLRGEMSKTLFAAHRAGKVQIVMARGSDFYGPGVLGSTFGERTLLPLLQGKPAEVTGSLDQPHTYTYINDFGEAMAILGEREEPLGQAWHVPNPPTLTHRELITLFFNEVKLEPKFSVMSRMKMRIGGLFIPAARETVEMMYEFEKPFVVDASKFIRAFGDCSTPLEQTVKETIAWYREALKATEQGKLI
jgi:nucleoside-diphosphate-sugar epimerase